MYCFLQEVHRNRLWIAQLFYANVCGCENWVLLFWEQDQTRSFPTGGNGLSFSCPARYLLLRPIPEWPQQYIVSKREYVCNARPKEDLRLSDINEWAV